MSTTDHDHQTPAGWYDDPSDGAQLRYWDGSLWTHQQRPREQQELWVPAQAAPMTPRRKLPKKGLKAGLAIVTAVVAVTGAYLAGVNSTQGEIRAAEHDAASAHAELRHTRAVLRHTRASLTDAKATLAACDADKASAVFDDAIGALSEIVSQYDDYMNNDDTYFYIDWDRVNMAGYTGTHPLTEQFHEALAACTTGGTV